ncbi:MAG: hypothetical protein ACYTDT_05740 [Planctomycetota bacterium]
MKRTLNRTRSSIKGGALAAALFFMIVVTTAGIALLSSSTRNQLVIIERSVDIRLMIAVESAVETVRGRFKLVQGVQDNWNWLSSSSWTTIDTVTINGIPVTLQAQSIGGPSVPTAKVRGFASASNITRYVGYDIKVASFSDYAMFKNSSGSTTFGTNFKQVGNYYTNGSLSCPNLGIACYGRTEIVGSFSYNSTYYPGGSNDPTLFPYQPANTNPSTVPMPDSNAQWDYLETVAEATDTFYAENTLEIEFMGTNFLRTYVYRKASGTGGGTHPTGTSWLTYSNGATNWTSTDLNNSDYGIATEVVAIPDEGVIYVDTGPANAITAATDSVSGSSRPNTWVQSLYTGTNTGYQTVRDNNTQTLSSASNNGGAIQCLYIHGVIDDRRCSIVCNHKIVVRDDLLYQSLVDTPELRRFNGDGTGRESPAALNMKEMLGVMSKEDVHMSPIWWESTAYNQRADGTFRSSTGAPAYGYIPGVSDQTGELIPNHFPTQTSAVDAVLFALGSSRPFYFNWSQGSNEWWLHGGLIAGENPAAGMGNHFGRRNYNWDFRMAFTMPPYFLRSYNVTAQFIPGTWKTWAT